MIDRKSSHKLRLGKAEDFIGIPVGGLRGTQNSFIFRMRRWMIKKKGGGGGSDRIRTFLVDYITFRMKNTSFVLEINLWYGHISEIS